MMLKFHFCCCLQSQLYRLKKDLCWRKKCLMFISAVDRKFTIIARTWELIINSYKLSESPSGVALSFLTLFVVVLLKYQRHLFPAKPFTEDFCLRDIFSCLSALRTCLGFRVYGHKRQLVFGSVWVFFFCEHQH